MLVTCPFLYGLALKMVVTNADCGVVLCCRKTLHFAIDFIRQQFWFAAFDWAIRSELFPNGPGTTNLQRSCAFKPHGKS
jgi:hypothetical protein